MHDNVFANLRNQWNNPADILSLLLLVGGDIVRMDIAQLVGHIIRPLGRRGPAISIAPGAFSFGWVAYGFINLLPTVGEKKLMPAPDSPAILVNCVNVFTRVNQSWALGRLLRDHEAKYKVDRSTQSIRIDIFELGAPSTSNLDLAWWLGWVTMAGQIGIASLPWILYGNWGVMLVVVCGNLLALLTCALTQWKQEKWAGCTLKSNKVTCLTRGNGHLNIVVFIGTEGSWDLEALATATSAPRPETTAMSLILVILWSCLLIIVSGIKEHVWFLIGIGGVGMLQNVFAAETVREPAASNFHVTPFSRMPTVIGRRQRFIDNLDAAVDLDSTLAEVSQLSEWLKTFQPQILPAKMPKWLETMELKDGVPTWLEPLKLVEQHKIANTHGALKELENWVPTAGLAMLQIYFPTTIHYRDECVKYNVVKTFWKKAYHTKSVRRHAEHRRREMEKNRNIPGNVSLRSRSERVVNFLDFPRVLDFC